MRKKTHLLILMIKDHKSEDTWPIGFFLLKIQGLDILHQKHVHEILKNSSYYCPLLIIIEMMIPIA